MKGASDGLVPAGAGSGMIVPEAGPHGQCGAGANVPEGERGLGPGEGGAKRDVAGLDGLNFASGTRTVEFVVGTDHYWSAFYVHDRGH